MSDIKNIVVLGGSAAGLGVAHYFLKQTYPSLKKSNPSTKYKLHLIEPSSHYYWRIAAPRATVSLPEMTNEKMFLPLVDGFKAYDKNDYELHQGMVTGVDTTSQTVTFKLTDSEQSETLTYYALVVATGTNTPTPMTSLHGAHTKTIASLEKMNKRLTSATSVVLGGGGPVAVETAGEIGEALNGAAGWFKSRPDNLKTKVTLISSSDKLLPVLTKAASVKAEKFLNRVGVDVIYNTRVEKVDLSESDQEIIGSEAAASFGKSTTDKSVVYLSNGDKMEVDVYIPAVGAAPNTSFLPKDFLNEKGFVKADKYLRIEGAGARMYTVGDVGAYTAGGIMSINAAVPVVSQSLANDLEGAKTKDKEYTFKSDASQFVPVGRSKGVAQVSGTSIPSVMVWAVKGRDYFLSMAKGVQMGSKY